MTATVNSASSFDTMIDRMLLGITAEPSPSEPQSEKQQRGLRCVMRVFRAALESRHMVIITTLLDMSKTCRPCGKL